MYISFKRDIEPLKFTSVHELLENDPLNILDSADSSWTAYLQIVIL